jgi:molecular chaperone DnaK
MKSALEKLTAVGGEIYQEVQKAGAAGGARESGPAAAEAGAASGKKPEKKADVVDADFEVVDDDKKK